MTSKADAGTTSLRSALGRLAEVRSSTDAEEPILAPNVRQALFAWLAEVRAKDDLRAVGLKPRTSALLFGPPGCGKTTLAHHMAARLGVPMVLVGPEHLQGKYLGESEGNTARLFDVLAASKTGCVLFLDEFEAVGTNRSKLGGSSADNARHSAVTVLLRKLEEFTGFCLAASNRSQDIDPAVWRRFHMQISVDLPTDDERFAILKRYAAPYDFDDATMDVLVALTDSASPALLRGLMEGMKRSLVIGAKARIDIATPVATFSRILAGLRPPPELNLPPLWSEGAEALADILWPPARIQEAA